MSWFRGTPVGINIDQIKLEVNDLPKFEEFNKEFDAQFSKGLKKIAYEAKDFWKSEAGRRLKRSRDSYQKSITVSNTGENQYTVVLGGRGGNASKQDKWLALAVENGIPSYDMKPGLLQGRQSRVIPLNTLDKGKIFRTVSVGQEGKWIFPGLSGLHLQDTVIDEINNTIIPKYVDIAYEKALKKL